MIDWPQSLIEELSARRAIVFLGAGASANATRTVDGAVQRPPSWEGYLNQLYARLNRGSDDDRAHGKLLLDQKRFLDAAEVFRPCIQDADYSRFVNDSFKDYKSSDFHAHVNLLDPKILVTTNYDHVYENLCLKDGASGYVVLKYYDEGLVARLRSPSRLILKVHGCMDTPERTVLTKSEYFAARQKFPSFFNTLESLFLTHTLVFIGYGLSDPDIQLLLENSSITAASAHPHYAVMPRGTHQSLRAAFRNTYNVEVLEYDSSDNHAELTQSLEALAAAVLEYRETQLNE